MTCKFCQNPLEEDCDFCSECLNEVVSIPKRVLCKEKEKNGIICGAELQKGKKFCKKCGAKVDQSIFEAEVVTFCENCGHTFADDEDFCVDCGFARNGFSDTFTVSTVEDSAALSFIAKTAPSPLSVQALEQNASLDDNVYKTSQTTLQDYDVHVEYKSDSPAKEIYKNTTEKIQTGQVQIENQPVVNDIDGTTSDRGTRICGKIDKLSYVDISIEKKTESDLESKSIFVNERSAVEVKDDGTLEDRDYHYTIVNLKLDRTKSDLCSATKTAELVSTSLLASSRSKNEAQVEKEKEVHRGVLEIEKEDINLKITPEKEQFIKDVKDLKSTDNGSDMSVKDKGIVDQTAQGKDVSQEQLSEGSDNPEKYENASEIEQTGNSSENEVVESTLLTQRLREENPKTKNVAIDKSTHNLREKEDDDRHFVEELEGNNIKAIKEEKLTRNQTSAVDEKTEDINEGTCAADQIKDAHAANKIDDTNAVDPSNPIDEVKADNIDKIPVQVTKLSIGPTNTTDEVEADKTGNIDMQIKNELNQISIKQNEVEELKENCTDKILVHGTRYTRNPNCPIAEKQENENEMSKEINQERHANGDGEPNENPNQEKTTSDSGIQRNESIQISNSPFGMETIESSKFDKKQSDEETKDSKMNQISDATVNKAHSIKNKPEGAKSLTLGKKMLQK
ncbi:hypothetical protein ACJMK2_027947 [Sinanodonta woodiana]|uniref:DZANK-type domain-containing protein n=1 Tax=Sinanodonta woodiana TaxID=1069815 RepID=A0ABD3X9E3_SINWO